MKQLNISSRRQSGVTLIVSLVILVALTVLGVTSMQSTRTEISMAGNQRELGKTFNAAEAGLRDGEAFVMNSISKTIYSDPSVGLYGKTDADPDYSSTDTWVAAKTATIALSDVYEQPKYVIRYLGDRSQNEVAAVNIGGYGSSQPGITVSNFRITARGTGLSGNARRYLQSYYGKEF
jgi:type IV pilus assembly protein PilX